MDNILEVSGLNKKYDNFSLKEVSFYLPEGCITGFIGINGAGKTTTLRTILGLTSTEHMQDVLTERPTIEDIMLANVERRKKNVI